MLSRRGAVLALLVPLPHSLAAQSAPRPDGPGALVRRHVTVLAADSLEGRGAGYRGDSLAAAYVAGEFARIGLVPVVDGGAAARGHGAWVQRFTLHPRRPPVPLQTLVTQNVVGLLEGSDPALRHELVVVGAHYDGQGIPGQADMGRRATADGAGSHVWNAANDNASGTAAMLAVAELLAGGARPRRSVLFIAFGAEEHGLVGSLHYAARPLRPWTHHVAMINLEMIGWEPDRAVNVRATSTSSAWPALLDSATALTGVATTRNQPALTNDTDHYGFGVRGVPAVHYGVGGARDHYHAVTDDASRIAFDALAERTRHVAALARLVADADAAPPFTWRHPRDPGITGTALTVEEHAALGLAAERGAVKVNAVAAGLPAAAAGVEPGDVIVAVSGRPFARGEPGLRVLAEAAAGADGVEIELLRAGERRRVRLGH